jgi:hypothetical protein
MVLTLLAIYLEENQVGQISDRLKYKHILND